MDLFFSLKNNFSKNVKYLFLNSLNNYHFLTHLIFQIMKQTFFIALFILFSSSTFAQLELGPRATLGTAFTSAENTSDNISSGKAQYNFGIGLYSRIGSKKIKLMPELLYVSSRTSIAFKDQKGVKQFTEAELDQVHLPINLVIKPGKILSFQGGVSGNYNLETKDNLFAKTSEARRNFKDFTYGYQAGLGLDISSLRIDLRYDGSLSEISKSNSGTFKFDERQSMIKLLIGFNLL